MYAQGSYVTCFEENSDYSVLTCLLFLPGCNKVPIQQESLHIELTSLKCDEGNRAVIRSWPISELDTYFKEFGTLCTPSSVPGPPCDEVVEKLRLKLDNEAETPKKALLPVLYLIFSICGCR